VRCFVRMTQHKYNKDIFGALVADHDVHRRLLDEVEQTSGDTPERLALFEELTYELKGHALAEEQALWSTVLRKPEITEDGRHAVAEHKEIDDLLNDLAATDMATGGWLTKFKTLKHEYLHHIDEEEEELFPDVEKHLDQSDQEYMAGVFKRRKAAEKENAEVTPEKKKKD
jgi:hemerythrin-like domain-containing protein